MNKNEAWMEVVQCRWTEPNRFGMECYIAELKNSGVAIVAGAVRPVTKDLTGEVVEYSYVVGAAYGLHIAGGERGVVPATNGSRETALETVRSLVERLVHAKAREFLQGK